MKIPGLKNIINEMENVLDELLSVFAMTEKQINKFDQKKLILRMRKNKDLRKIYISLEICEQILNT